MIKKIKNKLSKDANLKELLSGSAITFVLKMGGMGLSYVLIFLISKQLGAEGVGFFQLMLQILTVLGMVLGLGMNIAVLRYVGQFNNKTEKNKINDLYNHFVSTVGPLSLIISIILYFSAEWIMQKMGKNAEYTLGLQVVAFALPLFTINQISVELIRGLKKLQISELIRSVLRPLIMIIGITILSFNKISKMDVVYLLFIATVINSMFSRFSIWKNMRKMSLKRSNFTKKELIKTSLPIMASNISSVLTISLPMFYLDYCFGQKETGVYTVAYKISVLISLSLVIINTISAPFYSKLFWSGNIKELKETIKKATRISSVISLILAVPILMFTREILLFFGNEYIDGVRVLQVLVIAQLINTLSGPTGLLLNMIGDQKVLRNISAVIFLSSTIIYFLFLNTLGVLGVAIIYSASIIIQNIITIIFIYRKWGILSYFH